MVDAALVYESRGETAGMHQLTEVELVLVVGHGMQQTDSSAGVADGLLHEIYIRVPPTALCRSSCLFATIPALRY